MPEIKSHVQVRSPISFGRLSDRFAAALDKDWISRKQSNGAEDCGDKFLGLAQEGNKAAVNSQMPPPVSGADDKRHKKPKSSKRKGIFLQDPESTDGSPSTANNCRYDSSLSLLTKKFLNLLQQAEDGTLDLNRAAETLDVQKRRIYDITNVLEGVGLIEKKLKNMIRWKGNDISRPKELNDQIADLKVEIETLYEDECKVDEMIREMHESLRAMSEDERNLKRLFVTKEDINNLPCFKEATLIAVKAPHGTSVEVPDPDEGLDCSRQRYQILLRSSMGPINCYLLSSYRDEALSQQSTNQDTVVMTSEQGLISSGSFISQDDSGGLVKIAPTDVDMDADYLLLSEPTVSVTDSWTEYAE